MENQRPSSFKFSVDEDERPDSLFQAKREKVWRENRRVESLSRRLTLVSIFIPLLIAILGGLAYFELENRFANIHTSGSTEVQAISQAMETRFSSLEDAFTKRVTSLEQSLAKLEKTVVVMEKTVGSLEGHLKKAEKRIESVSDSKADKKALTSITAQMEKPLGPLRDELKAVRDEVQSVNEKFAELAAVSETVRTAEEKFTQLKAEMTEQLSDKIDQETLDGILKKHQNNYREELNLIIENLDRKEGKLNSLRDQLKKLEAAAKKSGRGTTQKPAATPQKQPPQKHPIDDVKPAPGTFIEQDLQ